ncbi:MAG: hypothetical protein PHH82_01750 [Candidatus ainarchaeum sp.]|nr:hypothetical protein [Candidatus ainarchaeum sp.]
MDEKLTIDFNDRFGIKKDDFSKFTAFQADVINGFNDLFPDLFPVEADKLFCRHLHIVYRVPFFGTKDHTHIYHNLSKSYLSYSDAPNSYLEFYRCLEIFLSMLKKEKKDKYWSKIYVDFFDLIIKSIKINGLKISFVELADSIVLYPSEVKELDEIMVQDIKWLTKYPESQKQFISALKKLQETNKDERNILDDLRFSLEQLLKKILKNDKSLENQIESLGGYLKDKGVSVEIRELYTKLINYYCNYQNKNVKHNEKYYGEETRFILYLTGSFMYLVLSIENK